MEKYLQATAFINSDHPEVIEFAETATQSCQTAIEKVVALYYEVRDRIFYDPYRVQLSAEGMCASSTLQRGRGYCIEKSIVMAAAARHLGIPSLLGFANVRNHLATPKFLEALRSDIFVFHGYVSLFINEKWVKATPVFNLSLCEKFNVQALDFDGINDSIFQEYDQQGQKYMEYLTFHGEFDDMPLALFEKELRAHYPHIFEETKEGLNWG